MGKKVVTAKHLLERLSAESAGLSGLSVSPFGALNDLVRKNAQTVMDPIQCDELVDRLIAENKDTVLPTRAVEILGVADLSGLIIHPYFVRAAARRGLSFYIAADGSVNRHTHATSSDVVSTPIEDPVDTNFFVEPEWFANLERFVDRNEPVLLIGPSGSGKTESVERVFQRRKQQLQIVSCTPSMSADDFEGKIDLVGGETVFTPSSCAVAVRDGHGLLLDEVDAAPAEACYSLYRALTGKDMRIARQGYDGVIPVSPQFRAVGTQNTEGRGDDRGIHHGRSLQDEAFLDRWPVYIRVDYPHPDAEILILMKRTGVSKAQATKIIKVATELRRAFASNRIVMCTTMRRTLAVAANVAAGFTPETSWKYSVQNRATTEDMQTIEDFINRVYGSAARKHE